MRFINTLVKEILSQSQSCQLLYENANLTVYN